MTKPIVLYKPDKNNFIIIGMAAYILPINHPTCTNRGHLARTSRVISYDEKTGDFETMNTIYKLQ